MHWWGHTGQAMGSLEPRAWTHRGPATVEILVQNISCPNLSPHPSLPTPSRVSSPGKDPVPIWGPRGSPTLGPGPPFRPGSLPASSQALGQLLCLPLSARAHKAGSFSGSGQFPST